MNRKDVETEKQSGRQIEVSISREKTKEGHNLQTTIENGINRALLTCDFSIKQSNSYLELGYDLFE